MCNVTLNCMCNVTLNNMLMVVFHSCTSVCTNACMLMVQTVLLCTADQSYMVTDACRYNTENGGPALEKLTNAIHDGTTKIKKYFIADEDLSVDYRKTGTTQYLVQTHGSTKFRPFTVQVCLLLCNRARSQDPA